jgi:hypothetical protein
MDSQSKRSLGGMTLSLITYELLRAEKPDWQSGWPGYGAWLVEAMNKGIIRAPKGGVLT